MDKSVFFGTLREIAKEKGVDVSSLVEKVKAAMLIVVRKECPLAQSVAIEIDEGAEKFDIEIEKVVVSEVLDTSNEISIEDAEKISKHVKIGSIVKVKLDPKKVGRIAAQGAKQIIRQGIRAIERDKTYLELKKKEGAILTAIVRQSHNQAGFVAIEVDGVDVFLPKSEQLSGQTLCEGDEIKVYISEVLSTEKGPKIMISRTSLDFIEKLFDLEIPEIADSTVKIMAIAREAGFRTKVAVVSNDPNVDPVGTCIGQRGMRINKIIETLGNEKIDVIKYDEDKSEFIKLALLPAQVDEVIITDEVQKECEVLVPTDQVSLAIGHKGQNVRLVAKLTGFKINIKMPENK
jgi:N utilization substance protein A